MKRPWKNCTFVGSTFTFPTYFSEKLYCLAINQEIRGAEMADYIATSTASEKGGLSSERFLTAFGIDCFISVPATHQQR